MRCVKKMKLSITRSFPVERCLLNYKTKDLYVRLEAGLSVLKNPLNFKLCAQLGHTVFFTVVTQAS